MGVIVDAILGPSGLVKACSEAFELFGAFFECLPVAVQICVYASVGLLLTFGLLKLFIS